MPSSEEWAHVVEVVKSTGDEAAISTLTSLIVVYVNPPKEESSPKEEAKEENSPKEEIPVEEAVKDKMEEVYGQILANTEASGDSAKVASVKRAYDMTPDSEEEQAKKLLKMSELSPVMAAVMARLNRIKATTPFEALM